MERVQELGQDLQVATIVCKNGRRHLDSSRVMLIKGGLSVFSKTRKKKVMLVSGMRFTFSRLFSSYSRSFQYFSVL
jgi:hypothetical protein